MIYRPPLLSIIIPLYNTEEFIEQGILSIVDNKVNPAMYEIVVVNDGSTDSSAQIVERLCAEHQNIHLFHQQNQGVSVARTAGISYAKGEFIWFIDSDDWLLEGALPTVMDILEHVPDDLDGIHAPLQNYFGETRNSLSTPLVFENGATISGKDLLRSGHISVCPPEFVFRRKLFDQPFVYFPEKTRHEDEYFCRVLQYGCRKLLQINEPFYAYRQHDNSFMYSGGIKSAQGLLNVYKHLSAFVDDYVDESDKDWFRKENLSLLTATHFWFPDLIGTPDFRAFQKQNGSFILSEFKKYSPLLERKDRLIGWLMLRMPRLFKWRYTIQSSIKNSRNKTAAANQKSICFLLPGRLDLPGGGARVIFSHANHLNSLGYQVSIVNNIFSPSREKFLVEQARKLYVIVRFIYRSLVNKNTCRGWFPLSKGIQEKKVWSFHKRNIPKADIYIATDATTTPYLLDYPVENRNKFYLIQGYENWRITEEQLLQTYAYPFKKIVVAKWLYEKVSAVDPSCELCLNGYDSSRFTFIEPIETRDPLAISMMYSPLGLKNSKLGIDALKKVHQVHPDIKVYLFGISKRPDDLPDWIDYREKPDQISHNNINNTAAIYIATSNSEGFSLPILEAMACGQAVSCTDIQGYRELAVHGVNSLISPPGDMEAMAQNILYLIENPDQRILLAKKAREMAKDMTLKNSSIRFTEIIERTAN